MLESKFALELSKRFSQHGVSGHAIKNGSLLLTCWPSRDILKLRELGLRFRLL